MPDKHSHNKSLIFGQRELRNIKVEMKSLNLEKRSIPPHLHQRSSPMAKHQAVLNMNDDL